MAKNTQEVESFRSSNPIQNPIIPYLGQEGDGSVVKSVEREIVEEFFVVFRTAFVGRKQDVLQQHVFGFQPAEAGSLRIRPTNDAARCWDQTPQSTGITAEKPRVVEDPAPVILFLLSFEPDPRNVLPSPFLAGVSEASLPDAPLRHVDESHQDDTPSRGDHIGAV
eukprot:CAMPEP_0201178692 /NCGR_PEP_ID=MMETSP0851-20130426/111298_1 /ASSEMBLY_ACC=CAM_ASM_000631 /TAXON_ID=183588 /ORGANISM="Pseudo-nitzschia fraudulenta, Strain WWA7" /LENGTH=165 /DNA_ID=CAMNT_0047462537 /DNA_START=75 /DNA_END=573 /DNA_ORIENTATION=+